MTSPSILAPGGQYLSFYLGGEAYAVEILRVREIIEFDALTKVPGTPPWVRGVINLRGSVVPVIDLSCKFGLAPAAVAKRSCIVMVELELDGKQTVMGILSDAVSQVFELAPADIEAPPPFGTQIRIDYLVGMGKAGKKFVLLLDIDKVLTADDVLNVIDPAVEGVAASAAMAGLE